MPVLEPVSDEGAEAQAKEIFDKLRGKMKMVPNIFRTMAHAPDVLGATLQFTESCHGALDLKLGELAYLKASMVNECHY